MSEYAKLFNNTEIKHFFESIPWTLTGSLQQHETLQKTLISEHSQYKEEYSHRFSLLFYVAEFNLHDIEWLIYCLILQSYPHWQLILIGDPNDHNFLKLKSLQQLDSRIETLAPNNNEPITEAMKRGLTATSGQYLIFLQHSYILHPQSLGLIAKSFLNHHDSYFLYTNEIFLDQNHTIEKIFHKPKYSLASLKRINYIGNSFVIKKDYLLEKNISLDCILNPQNLCQVNDFYGLHLPIYACYLTKTSIKDSLQIANIQYSPMDSEKLTIIIPFKDQAQLTIKCLQSLTQQKLHERFNILLVNNRSDSPESLDFINKFIAQKNSFFHSIKIIDYNHPFNFSALHNWVLKNHPMDPYILFLNNDVEFVDSNAMSKMLGELSTHPKIGFVGIRLQYPNSNKIQFGGINIQLVKSKEMFFHTSHITNEEQGYPYHDCTVAAITFACAMTRKSVLDEIGGFDAINFPNSFSDAYLCLKAYRHGFESFYLGTAMAIHHESATRIMPDDSFEILAFNQLFSQELNQLRVQKLMLQNFKSGNNNSDLYLPLRYQIADKINNRVKTILGPIHRLLKRRLR